MEVRIVTPCTTEGFSEAADFQPFARSDCRVSQVCLTVGPPSIESARDEVLAAPDTVARIVEAAADGVDAAVIDCVLDPGLTAAREAVDIHVVGAGQAAFHLAALTAHSFSIISAVSGLDAAFEQKVSEYGLAGRLRSIRSLDIPVLELESDEDRLMQRLLSASIEAVEHDGAHAIVFGCTGMKGCAARLASSLHAAGYHGVPVIDPILAALKLAESLVDLGVPQSRVTYPRQTRPELLPLIPETSFSISAENLADYVRGCALLGSGGGGDVGLGEAMARQAIGDFGPVPVVPLTALPDDTLVMPIAMIGAPTVARERIFTGREGTVLRDELEERLQQRVGALMVNEIGGLNGLLPLTWAAVAGLPLVDADGMGRAFPLVTQVAMRLSGLAMPICVAVGGNDTIVAISTSSDDLIETMLRSATESFGGVCVASLYQVRAQDAARAVIPRSLSRAVTAGAASGEWPAELNALEIFEGTVVDVRRTAEAAFVHGAAVIDGTGEHAGSTLRLEFQNENLVALVDGVVRVTTPHIITVLGRDDLSVVSTEQYRFGQVVRVVALGAPDRWLTPEGLSISGPRAFGYDLDCVEAQRAGLVWSA